VEQLIVRGADPRGHGRRIFAIYPSSIYDFLHPSYHGDSFQARDAFVSKLNMLFIFNYTERDLEAKEGRTASGTVDELTEEEFESFMGLLKDISGHAGDLNK